MNEKKPAWTTVTRSAGNRDGLISIDQVAEWEKAFGGDSEFYRIKIKGQWPDKEKTMDKPKIFVHVCNERFYAPKVGGVAMAEDGEVLATHVSDSEQAMLKDLGVNGTKHHDRYIAKYPETPELVFVALADIPNHAGLIAAIAKNEERAKASAAAHGSDGYNLKDNDEAGLYLLSEEKAEAERSGGKL